MRRTGSFALGLAVGIVVGPGLAAAQDVVLPAETVNSDGSYVVADDQSNTNVSGEGTNVVYGDITTGNTGGEVLGDPNAIYYPDLSAVPSVTGEPHSPTIVGLPIGRAGVGDLIPGIDFSLIAAPEAAPGAAPVGDTTGIPVEGAAPSDVGTAEPAG